MPPQSSIEPLESRIAPAFAANLDLADLDGTNGFKLNGGANRDGIGISVANAGDVNGDGFADVIVGADRVDGVSSYNGGAAYVIFGRATGFPSHLEPSALDGQNGFKLAGDTPAGHAGISVGAAGDVNGDGFDDVIVGSVDVYDNGAAYVVFGKVGGFPAELHLSALDGSNGFKLTGFRNDLAGFSVSGAGDVNGDGFADVIVGAPENPVLHALKGTAYVVFGKGGGFAPNLNLTALDGGNGFALIGGSGDHAGYSVSEAGDVNGDGFADVIVGASQASPNGLESGSAYVVFGHGGAFSAKFDLPTVDGANGFRLDGSGDFNFAGEAASGIGSINGDGFADILVATNTYTYVIYGHAGTFPANLSLTAINGTNGFVLTEGVSSSSAGDVNGDGVSDLIVGFAGVSANDTYSGAAYVVFGKAGGLPAQVDVFTLDGQNGFRLSGAKAFDYAGRSVSGGGDINGDGFPDLIIGAPIGVPGHGSGKAYVVYGGDPGRLQIASDGHSATFTDPDGDRVTVQTSAGVFTKAMFDLRAEGFGFQLEALHLTDAAFAKANLTLSATPENVDGLPGKEGDGFVKIGYLDATGIDLGKVKIAGDLGRIDAGNPADPGPALTFLAVQHLGKQGITTQDPAAPSLHSDLNGSLSTLRIAHGIHPGVTLAIAGKLGTATLGGNLTDATLSVLGKLAPATQPHALALASLTIGGSVLHSQILAGYDLTGAATNADASIGTVIVGGAWSASSLVAGIADSTGDGFGQNDTLIPGGSANIIATIASVLIKGRASGSMATGDFYGITAEQIDSANIALTPLALTANKDTLPLDPANNDFRLAEV